MGKLLPVLIAVVGLVIGVGAGIVLKPDPPAESATEEGAADAHDTGHAEKAGGHGDAVKDDGHGEAGGEGADFVKLNNQFVIPVVRGGRVSALVVMSLSLEVGTGGNEYVYKREPKLRDSLLQVMFDHANSGGFDGNFTESGNMTLLRRALLEAAQQVLGPTVSDVLIIDIVRQDA